MIRFMIKSGDTKQPLRVQVTDEKGKVDLTGCTVRIVMANYEQNNIVLDEIAIIADAINGIVEYPIGTSITTPSTYYGEFEVTFPDGKVELFPKKEKILIGVIPSLRDSITYDAGSYTDIVKETIDGGTF